GDEMNNLYKELENADGAAQQMSDTMESGLAGSVRSLKSAYEGLQIVIGEQFAEMAQGAVGDVTELVRDITEILNDGCQEGDITAIGERISSFLIQGINLITEYIPGAIDMIATMLTELVNVLVELLTTLLPPLLEGAIALLTGIIEAIVGNIEPLVEMVVYLVTTVAEFIIENLPILINAAIQIVIALANGIADALPQIINSIINFITSNLPMIIDMGIRIILQLVVGIIKAIPSLVAALPQIVMALITGIGKAAIAIVDIGRNIVRGLWDGIASMVTWIKDKISNFVGGIVSGVKGLLGIKSPSTVFAGIGDDMAQGLGVGFDKAMSQVSEDIQDAVPTDFDIQSNVNVGANGIATSQDGYGSLITIQQMIVRSEDDIRKVSQELYNLIQTGSRAQGR